jgi:nitrite reductase/ring-hydroxylating ferredoxin subunit
MADWHRLGTKDELLARVPCAIKVERHRIALFLYNGRLTAIPDIGNHKGGPLSEGQSARGGRACGDLNRT